MRFMPTKANCFVKPFDQPIPRAATSATRFLPMLIVAGLLFQFPGPQPIQAAPARAVPAIAVSPGSVSLGPVQTQQFTTRTLGGLSIGGLITTNVTWTLSPLVGSISAAGLYTAPASISSPQTVTVKATSAANPTNPGTATVTLNPPVNVTVSPASVTLTQSQTQTFSTTVTNTGNTAVTWSLSPVVGSITAAGLYTAPASITSSQTVTVKATSAADPTKSATATVALNPTVTVSLTPSSVSLQPSQNQTFTASVSGTSNTGVTWSLNPALGGLVSGATTAVYAAPSTAPTTQGVTITAASMADPSKTATAVITLLQAITVSLSPSTVSLAPSGTQAFTATVLGTSNTAVTWSINPSVGAISSAGLYAAPSTILTSQTVTVTAQSVADPTKSASAQVSFSTPVTSFTYYVDSVNGSDSNPGTLAEPWKTVAKVNATTLHPGQSVGFKSGGTWQESLIVPSSGSAGNPITFGAYGVGAKPVINPSTVVSSGSWTGGPVYTVSATTKPYEVFEDTIPLVMASSSGLSNGNWYWASKVLYYKPTAGTPTSHLFGYVLGTLPPTSNLGINGNDKSYFTVDGLRFVNAYAGVELYETSTPHDHITIQNNDFLYSRFGVENVIATTSGNGVENGNYFYRTCSGSAFGLESENAVSHTAWGVMQNQLVDVGTIDGSTTWSTALGGGIQDQEGISLTNLQNSTITENTITGGFSVALYLYQTANGTASDNIISYNSVSNNASSAFFAGGESGASLNNNIVAYNLFMNDGGSVSGEEYPYYIVFFQQSSGSRTTQQNYIVNNTIYGGYTNAFVLNLTSPPATPHYLTLENNIVYDLTRGGYNVYDSSGAESTLIINNNMYGYITLPSFAIGGANRTWVQWQTDGHDKHGSAPTDPLFVNAGAGNFALQFGSPAIGAGAYINGVSTANPPSMGMK